MYSINIIKKIKKRILLLLSILILLFQIACSNQNIASISTNDKRVAKNKEVVLKFYDLAFIQGKFKEAAENYIGDIYIQHNPTVADGAKAFVDIMTKYREKFPNTKTEVKRVIAEDDLVMLHVFVQASPESRGRAVTDIFRVDENGKIVEHWDVGQDIPEKSVNANTMF